jgi:hypothetical protein
MKINRIGVEFYTSVDSEVEITGSQFDAITSLPNFCRESYDEQYENMVIGVVNGKRQYKNHFSFYFESLDKMNKSATSKIEKEISKILLTN